MTSFVRIAVLLATIPSLTPPTPALAQPVLIRVIDGDGAPVGLTSVAVLLVRSDGAIARRLTSSGGTLTHRVPDAPGA